MRPTNHKPFTFDDRMEIRRIRDFVLSFYNGDINETFQKALRYYYSNKLEAQIDRDQLEQLIQGIEYTPPQTASQRIPLNIPKVILPLARSEARSAEGRATIEEARDILGDDFFGPEALVKIGVTVAKSEIPGIQFTAAELERAKELDQFLILRRANFNDGEPLTMQRLERYMQMTVDAKRKGKILYNDWFKGEDFFKNATPRPGWALVSKQVMPGTQSKNYLQQTERIAEYLKTQVFRGGAIPADYQAAITDFDRQKSDIARLWEVVVGEKLQNNFQNYG